jgi:hypothetical protein
MMMSERLGMESKQSKEGGPEEEHRNTAQSAATASNSD